MENLSESNDDLVIGSAADSSMLGDEIEVPINDDDDEESLDGIDCDGLDTFLTQPMYPNSACNEHELDYMVCLALATLHDCPPDHLKVVCTHLNGLQPELTTQQLARSLLNFFIKSGERRASLERRLLALVKLLSKAEWSELGCAVVATVPDSLTSPDGPTVDNEGAIALGRLAGWICLLINNGPELLRLLAEILGRGGPRTAPACLGILQAWPAVLGVENLSSCIFFCIDLLVAQRDDDYAKKLKEHVQLHPYYETQELSILKEQLLEETKKDLPPGLCFSLLLLSRIFGPPLVVSDLIDYFLLPIINGHYGEDEHSTATAVVLMGLICRDLAFGRSKGRLVARRYILAAILEVLDADGEISSVMSEAVATGLLAAVGAGRPKLLEEVLEKVPAASVTPAFKRRLNAWSLKNLQPVFQKRKRKRKSAEDADDNDDQDAQDSKRPPFTYKDLEFPETIKELLNSDDLTKIKPSECRFNIDEDDECEIIEILC